MSNGIHALPSCSKLINEMPEGVKQASDAVVQSHQFSSGFKEPDSTG
jgi:hypothetical protein